MLTLKKVYFIIENENGNSQSIEESENRKDASTENDIEEVDEADLICVPMASMDFEGLFYEDVVQMFENAVPVYNSSVINELIISQNFA